MNAPERDSKQHPRRQLGKRGLILALAIVGMLVSAYLEVLHVQTYFGLSGTGYCEAGEHVSCTSVALSGASVILGVPLPIWGLAGFLAVAVAAQRRSRLLLPLVAISVAASIALLVYEIVVIGSICMWCELVHVLCFGLLVLAWLDRDSERPPITAKSVALELGPSVLVVLATALLAPAYWVTASWGSGTRLPHGVDEDGRPWLGSASPQLVIHEYVDYACPHCRIASARMKMKLAEDPGLRVVRHQQPRMRCGTEAGRDERCQYARAAICAGEQDRFWEMDDWLFHHVPGTPKLDAPRAAQDVGLDLDAFLACMESAEAHARAQADVDEAKERGIRGTPGYVIDGRRVEVDELRQVLDER